MPPSGDTQFAKTEVGGLEHPPESIPGHFQLGAADVDFLQDTISMSISTQQRYAQLQVTVTLTNTGAGHHVPTDFPGRHLILVVSAEDVFEVPLTFISGPIVPVWGGDHAELPGKGYAKVLKDVLSGEAPVVSYWKQSVILSDNRLPAMGKDSSTYYFSLPDGGGDIVVSARLIFRRVFQDIAEQKDWGVPDITMVEITKTIPIMSVETIYFPILLKNP